MENVTLGQRLKSLRKQHGLSQAEAGAAVGLTQTAYGRYEVGSRDPDTGTLAKLAQLFGVSVDYLMGVVAPADTAPEQLPSNLVPMNRMPHYYVPKVSGVTAGTPLYMEENYCVYVDSPRQCDYALVLPDDSMAPAYLAGDVVYVRSAAVVDDGSEAVVALGDKCIVRRFYRIKDGVQLSANDPHFAPGVYLGEDAGLVNVIGVIVGYTRMYKRGAK